MQAQLRNNDKMFVLRSAALFFVTGVTEGVLSFKKMIISGQKMQLYRMKLAIKYSYLYSIVTQS